MQINKPIYWSKKNIIAFILFPFTIITFIINLIKKNSSKKKYSLKTICVGNIYIGGTGKTSLCISINKILNKKYKTVFIKKNYSNQLDEQNLLRSHGKLLSNQKRKVSLKIAEKKAFDVAVLDDGLQDKSINYDISIACFNSSSGIGNGYLLPAGPLRENISALNNYDAIFLNGEKKNKKLNLILKKIKSKPKIFKAIYTPTNLKNFNRNKNFLFFCGIGNPDEFKRTLNKYKFKLREEFIFPDHHNYSNAEVEKIKQIAKNKKLEIITTEKDYYRLNNKNKKNIKCLKIILKIKNIKSFSKFLNKKI
tara:strand:+ start:1977 stop:2900 length:924 start_codon:yes stop_codon:yes gene_type:complete